MSYTLTPIIIDIRRLKSVIRSKDATLLQSLIKKHRKDMLDVDAMGEDYEDAVRSIILWSQ